MDSLPLPELRRNKKARPWPPGWDQRVPGPEQGHSAALRNPLRKCDWGNGLPPAVAAPRVPILLWHTHNINMDSSGATVLNSGGLPFSYPLQFHSFPWPAQPNNAESSAARLEGAELALISEGLAQLGRQVGCLPHSNASSRGIQGIRQ